MSYSIYNETFYLSSYPDVRAAVANGAFASGLQHFQQIGLREGRTAVSAFWNEQQYLAANADIRAVVNARTFSSGLQHFILFGEAERRPGATVFDTPPGFNENYYYALYPDIGRAVASGVVRSGQSHFISSGRFENRIGFFSGSTASDIVAAVGPTGNAIVGISVDINATISGRPDPIPRSVGVGEIDVLIGGDGADSFGLGFGRSTSNANIQRFYVGQGNNDYAYIENFQNNFDRIQLAGSPNEYFVSPGPIAITGNTVSGVSIFTTSGDLVAVVEGIASLQIAGQDANAGIFFYT